MMFRMAGVTARSRWRILSWDLDLPGQSKISIRLMERVLLIFGVAPQVQCVIVNGFPKKILKGRECFTPTPEIVGDYDCIRNTDGRLAGFLFSIYPDEGERFGSLSGSLPEFAAENGFLSILLAPVSEARIDVVQGLGAKEYVSDSGTVIFAVPECWGCWGDLAFPADARTISQGGIVMLET